jgi:hypothetical protein
MSIVLDVTEDVLQGDGENTIFPSTVVAFEAAQIKVYLREADSEDELLTLTTNYTLSNFKAVSSVAENDAGVTVTMVVPPTVDQSIVVVRETPITQELELRSVGSYNPEALMQQLDLIVMATQELKKEVARSYKVSPGLDNPETVPVSNALDNLLTYAQQAADSAAAAQAAQAAAEAAENTLITPRGNWATSTVYSISDIVRQGTAQYRCIVPHTSGVFATDFSALRWEVWLQDGAAGPGSGDMLNEDNLEFLADPLQSCANLGFNVLGLLQRDRVAAIDFAPGADSQGSAALSAFVAFARCASISSQSGITLPPLVTGEQGKTIVVSSNNNSTADLIVYPDTGDNFEGKATNAPIAVPRTWKLIVWQLSTSQWGYVLLAREAPTSIVRARAFINNEPLAFTYSRTLTTVTVTCGAIHGLTTGMRVISTSPAARRRMATTPSLSRAQLSSRSPIQLPARRAALVVWGLVCWSRWVYRV